MDRRRISPGKAVASDRRPASAQDGRLSVWRRRSSSSLQASSGQITYALLQAGTFSIIALRGGAIDTAGFLLAQAVATPLSYLAGLQLNEQFATEARPSAYHCRIRRMMIVSAAVFPVGTMGWFVLGSGATRWVGTWVLLANLAQIHVTAYQGRRARSQSYFAASQLDSVLGLASVVSIGMSYALNWGLATGCLLMASAWCVIGGAVTLRALRLDRVDGVESLQPPESFRDDLVLGFSAMIGIGQASAARLGTAIVLGAVAVAKIGTVSYVVQAGALLTLGARLVLAPHLGGARAHGTIDLVAAQVKRRLREVVLLLVPTGFVVGFTLAPPILEYVFSSEVAPDALTGGVVIAAAGVLYGSMLIDQVAIALDRRAVLLRANIVSVAVTVILVYPLGAAMGIAGAALAQSLGILARYLAVDLSLLNDRSAASSSPR